MSKRTSQRTADQPSAFVAASGDRIEDMPNWDPVRGVIVLGGDRDALSTPDDRLEGVGHEVLAAKGSGPPRGKRIARPA